MQRVDGGRGRCAGWVVIKKMVMLWGAQSGGLECAEGG